MNALLKKYNNRENGFTLIELLIVVLIIGILAAVSIPVYLGIQNQAHKSAVKADVNTTVKQVQVSLTEGQPISALYGTKNGSDKGETVQIKASTTTGASASDFMVIGTDSTTATPASAINYTYSYDSFTGQFTDSDSGTAFGGGNQANTAPTITSGALPTTGTVGTAYSFTVTATGTPNPTFSATGLPAGVVINATTGVISGSPTAANTYNYVITVTNGTSPDATQSGMIVTSTPAAPVINTANLPDLNDNAASVTTVPIDVTGSPTLTWSGLPSCITASGATLKYAANCTYGFARANPTLTATNGGGTVTRQYYILEKFASSVYTYNNDFTSTGASDFTAIAGTVTNATAPDGRQALAVTQTTSSTTITQTTGYSSSGSAQFQYGAYIYVPSGVSATMCVVYSSSNYCANTVSTSGSWQQVNSGITGSNTTSVQVRFTISGAAGKTVYISYARMVKP